MKTCIRCKREFPRTLEYFYKQPASRDRLNCYCKPCQLEVGKIARQKRRATAEGAHRERARELELTYGISREDYEALLREAAGKCMCCLAPCPKPDLDHDHQTGKVRGLLCRSCNTALGVLQDKPERIYALARYAEQHMRSTLL